MVALTIMIVGLSYIYNRLDIYKDNKELSKVVYRYIKEKDIEKLRALKYILNNISYHSFSYSDGLVEAKDWFRLMRERPFSELQHLSDSIANSVDVYNGLQKKWDIHVLDSAYLCENIDMAFKVWREQPWGKNVSFNIFCKYILPYRIGDEIPELWRKEYYEEFNKLLDDFRNSDTLDVEDPVEAYKYLVSKIPIIHDVIYTSITPVAFPHIGPTYVRYNTGGCREFCDFMIYVCRSLGIPCALNYRLNDGHHWNTYWDKDAEEYVVSYFPKDIKKNDEDLLYRTTKLKVYRNNYAINKDGRRRLVNKRRELPPFFRVPLYEDATKYFTDNYVNRISIPNTLFNEKVKLRAPLYLCTMVRNQWVIEDYSIKGLFKSSFYGVQSGNVVCVAIQQNNILKPVTDPFIIENKTCKMKFFKQEGVHDHIVLKSKFHIEGEEAVLREMMRNGVFEASSTENFDKVDTLAIIQVKPSRQITKIKVYHQNQTPYKYVRYKGPQGSYCGVAEVCFYDLNGEPVNYNRVIGTASIDWQKSVTNVFDGNPSTSYEYYYSNGGWCGLELSEETIIGSISYTPRNRVNYIYADNVYELFYYDERWKSQGKIVAASDSLIYCEVPNGPLLYLKNHTTGVKEMIFTYENGKQKFYGCGMEINSEEAITRVSMNDWKCTYSFLSVPPNWMSTDFNDESWESGYGPLGTSEWCATKWSSKNLFVRYYFYCDDRDSLNTVILKEHINATSKVYLNGTEITLTNSTNHSLPLGLIKNGENVLAIKCVNSNLSDNVLCDIELYETKF